MDRRADFRQNGLWHFGRGCRGFGQYDAHAHNANKLFGTDYEWSVLAAGRHQMPFTTQSALLGGNVRVGLEDSLYIGPGKKATSSAEQVAKIRSIIENLGLSVASLAEARERLGLKGADQVKF